MFRIFPDRQKPAMDLRMQGFHPPIQEFGKPSQIGDIADLQTSIGKRCRLYPGVTLGKNCRLGDDVVLHPNVVQPSIALMSTASADTDRQDEVRAETGRLGCVGRHGRWTLA